MPTTQDADAVRASVEALQGVYGIVIALALAEAFRQFVRDPSRNGGDGETDWWRLPALAVVVFLIVPFFQGMQRYFQKVYLTDSPPSAYGGFILVDAFVFMTEGALFFMLARSLALALWRKFYLTVSFLLGLDIAWAVWGWLVHEVKTWPWAAVNSVFLIVLLVLLVKVFSKGSGWDRRKTPPVVLAIVLLARTIADYWASWDFYFPPAT